MMTQGVMGAVMLVGIVVLFGALAKLLDLRRKRETETVIVQAQVSDAILRNPDLAGFPITPSARVPFWKGSPVTVEVAGQVPSENELHAALCVIESEARRIRPDVRIESRISIVPSLRFSRRAA